MSDSGRHDHPGGIAGDSGQDVTPPTLSFSQSVGPADLAQWLETDLLPGMAAAWRAGLRMPTEDWLERHPEIADRAELGVRLVYEEVCLRQERGETVDSSEIYRRFPQWRDALQVLLDCHRLIQPDSAVGVFPEAGERLGEFQLWSEIDRGAVGRVFLATQPELSDRPLVVKLTLLSGGEHLSLARLQHTHIAPLYLVQEFPTENLRALCMPYLGGASWARVLQALKGFRPEQRTGRHIVEAISSEQVDAPIKTSFSGPALHFLSRASYVQAVCWIGSCLAEALQYAQQRGLVHLDIKPSNVLLAGDGQPMLLDFHLAQPMVAAGDKTLERLGGTRGYMSPEQEAAALEVRLARPLTAGLDGRTDIYSLGILLYESLCGHLPPADEAASRSRLRQLNPEVSRGLEDLVHKCLARSPQARYSDACELAADLRRHLADLPLAGVPNRSLAERWQKWRRRKPHALLVLAAVAITLTVTGVVGLLFFTERVREAELALEQGKQHLENGEFAPASERLETGWRAIRWIPAERDLKQQLQNQLKLAKKARLAGALHSLVERLRFLSSFETPQLEKLRELNIGCAAVWQAREQIVQLHQPGAATEFETQIRTDLLDLAVLWADLQLRLAPAAKAGEARAGGLHLLDQAEQLCGASPVLQVARREISSSGGPGSSAAKVSSAAAPRTTWEHYAVGRWLLRSDELSQAEAEFDRALELEPNAFWPNFYRAICAYRQERFNDALNASSVCVALAPKSAECFYNRALAEQALGHSQLALRDFTRALALDPKLAVAALHRGMLLSSEGRQEEALADLQLALAGGADPAAAYYQIALVQVARHDRGAALVALANALEQKPDHAPASMLKARLQRYP